MKKTLLAAALLAGYTGTALAQNSVTLYGRITPAYVFESVKIDDNAASTTGFASGTYNEFSPKSGFVTGGGHFGLKGTEDIGNGTKIGFVYEMGSINTQTGTGAGNTRLTYLSVSNDAWGTIHMGKDYTASSTLLSGISPVGTSYGIMSAEAAFGVFSVTAQNQIKYFSPSISGLTFGASYSFRGTGAAGVGEDSAGVIAPGDFGTSNQNRLMVAGLRYANGPLVIGGAYTQLNPNANGITTKKPKNWTIGATYDLKVAKLHAGYGQNIDGIVDQGSAVAALNGNSADAIPSNGTAGEFRTNQWLAGVSAPVGAAGKVFFSISQQRPGADLKDLKNDIGGDQTATMTNLGVAYQYSLSKRTSLNASYGYADNYGMVKGVSVNQVGIGLKHVF